MKYVTEQTLFPLGKIVMTKGVHETVPPDHTLVALCRHAQGDWCDLREEDCLANDDAMVHGARLLSRYESPFGTVLWIVTEHDRSYTTILLPNEY